VCIRDRSISVRDSAVAVDMPYASLSMLGNVSEDRVFYRILADEAVLTGYADLPPVPSNQIGPAGVFQTADYKGARVRIATATRRLSVAGTPVEIAVTVAQTLSGQSETLRGVANTALMLGAGFFALATGLALITAQVSLAPLRDLARAVARRGPKDLRPVAGPVPADMAPLVQSLNTFIDRLRQSLAQSEDFIAEAAHRVRTPLSTLRTQAEIALRRVEKPQNRAALKEMIRAIDDSSRAAGQLLDHAMVTFRTDHLARAPVDLNDLARDVVDRLRPIADLRDIDLHLHPGHKVQTRGDAILLENALRNVMDNAIKYSPPDSRIDVTVSRAKGIAQIAVADRAGGFPAAEIGGITARFARGTNAGDTVGSGLGLTIARDVAEAHGGHLNLSNHKEGACVTFGFPAC